MKCREGLIDYDAKQREEYVRGIIKNMDEFNELKKFRIDGIDSSSQDIEIDADFLIGRDPIEHNGVSIFPLNDFYPVYFPSFDGKRNCDFQWNSPEESDDSVEIIKTPGRKTKIDFNGSDISNKLLIAQCNHIETDSSYILTRHVEVKSVSLSADDVNKLYPDIELLNKIKETTVSFK